MVPQFMNLYTSTVLLLRTFQQLLMHIIGQLLTMLYLAYLLLLLFENSQDGPMVL